jgi:hypothetical protein
MSCLLGKCTCTRQVVCHFVTELALVALNLVVLMVGVTCFACLVVLLHDYILHKVCLDEVCPHKALVKVLVSYAFFPVGVVLLVYFERFWDFTEKWASSCATSSSKQGEVPS